MYDKDLERHIPRIKNDSNYCKYDNIQSSSRIKTVKDFRLFTCL